MEKPVNDLLPWRIDWATIPPMQLGPNQTEPILSQAVHLAWFADQAMDDDVTYEIARILYENMDEIKEYYPPTIINKNQLAMLPVPEDQFHPGALKLFKERGVPIGIE